LDPDARARGDTNARTTTDSHADAEASEDANADTEPDGDFRRPVAKTDLAVALRAKLGCAIPA